MKKRIIQGAVIVAIVAVLAIPKLDFFGGKQEAGSSRRTQGGAVAVEVTVIKTGELSNRVVVTGSVFANESLEIKGEISGKITNIFFREGKRVSNIDCRR